MASNIQDTVGTIGGALLAIAIVVVVLGAVFGLVAGIFGDELRFEPAPDEYATIVNDDDVPAQLELSLSTETQAQLGENVSYVDDPTPLSVFETGSWAVALTATPASDINQQGTYTLYAAGNETVHVLYEAGNWTARYDTGASSAYVEANATLDRTALVVAYNDTSGELSLYVDGGREDTALKTASSVSRDTALSWYGGLDEMQIINATVGGAGATAYASEPVAPLQPADASARLLFNEEDPRTVYYAGGDATFVGEVSIGAGVADPTIERGTDYELATSPVRFRTTDGGVLADAPVVFVSYHDGPFAGVFRALQSTGAAALSLLVVGLVALAARSVWRTVGSGGF